MLEAGQDIAVEHAIAQRNAFVRTRRLAGKDAVAGVDDTYFAPSRRFALLEAVYPYIVHLADPDARHARHAATGSCGSSVRYLTSRAAASAYRALVVICR